MQPPLKVEYKPAYEKYIDLAGDGDFLLLLKQNTQAVISFFKNIPAPK